MAVAYGPIIWLVMSLAVIPLATGRPAAITFRWWVQVFAHVPFVTLPLVFTAARRALGRGPTRMILKAGIESIAADVRYAFRRFRRTPLSTITMVLVLSLGIGTSVVLFTVMNSLATLPAPGIARDDALGSHPRHHAHEAHCGRTAA